MGILLSYKKRFTNPSPSFFGKNLIFFRNKSHFFRNKSLFPYKRLVLPYQGLTFQEVRDLETRKFVNKYILFISHLYPFVHSELAVSRTMVDGGLGPLDGMP